MHVCRKQKLRKVSKRNCSRTVDGSTTRTQLRFHAIGFCAGGIQPKAKALGRLLRVARVGVDKCVLVVSKSPIARIKHDPGSAAQWIRQRVWRKPRSKCDGREIGHELHAIPRDSTLRKSPRLVHSQHFEGINTTPPKPGQT